VPADSRYICKHLMMPVLEPSDPQELKDWIELAFTLSRESELYIGYLVTTNQGDGGGTVEARPNEYPEINTHNRTVLDTANIDFDRNVLLPPRTWRKEQNLPDRFARLWQSARRHGANKILPPSASPRPEVTGRIGFVTSAAAYCYLQHALTELGVFGWFPILKLGVTYPLDPQLIKEFARGKSDLFVIEERRNFLEEQVVDAINHARQAPKDQSPLGAVNVWGKQFPYDQEGIPSTRGLNPSKLIARVGSLLLAIPELKGVLDVTRIQREIDLVVELRTLQIE